MAEFITLKAADGFSCPAYVARPAGKPRGGIVVLQEIFGVNSHIQKVTERFAEQGYLAVAPATFARVKADVSLAYGESDMPAGSALKAEVMALPEPGVMQDIQAAMDYARTESGGKVGLIGFCWGGLLTWKAACTLEGLAAAVPYYGGGMTTKDEIARQPKCPVMAHFGDKDHWISQESVAAFGQAHPEVEVHRYAADHGFNCDQRGSYDEAAATLARQRTLAFFAAHLD